MWACEERATDLILLGLAGERCEGRPQAEMGRGQKGFSSLQLKAGEVIILQRLLLFSWFLYLDAEAAGGSAPVNYSGSTFVPPFPNNKKDNEDGILLNIIPCQELCYKLLTYIISFNLPNNQMREALFSHVQMRKLRLGELR